MLLTYNQDVSGSNKKIFVEKIKQSKFKIITAFGKYMWHDLTFLGIKIQESILFVREKNKYETVNNKKLKKLI